MAQVYINGTAHGWASVKTAIDGVPVTGITAISYSITQDKEDVYGSGVDPVERSYGNKVRESSMTLLGTELAGIEQRAEDGDLTNIAPFQVDIAIIPKNSTNIQFVTMSNCEFKNSGRGWAQNDPTQETELALRVGEIVTRR